MIFESIYLLKVQSLTSSRVPLTEDYHITLSYVVVTVKLL